MTRHMPSSSQHSADSHDLIRVRGARENNLKDVSVEIPNRAAWRGPHCPGWVRSRHCGVPVRSAGRGRAGIRERRPNESLQPTRPRTVPRRQHGSGPAALQLTSGVSNCLNCQAVASALASAGSACHGVLVFAIALRIVSSFRMQATSASFFGLPAARSRW